MKRVDTITVTELREMAHKLYGNLVKADIDVAKGIMVVDMDMHADGEAYLLENGSAQQDLWGVNLHPDSFKTDEFIEFDSMINLKPRQGNMSRDVLDADVRAQIAELVNKMVRDE